MKMRQDQIRALAALSQRQGALNNEDAAKLFRHIAELEADKEEFRAAAEAFWIARHDQPPKTCIFEMPGKDCPLNPFKRRDE